MGIVYRAYDAAAEREVAVKTIRDTRDRASLEQFRKECDVQKSLNHPNIVDIYDIGEFEGETGKRPYFVMPLLRGATLDQLIRHSSHRLTVERSVDIMIQMCRGLQAAHDRGLVHRDLKPSNIFVLEDDSVKVIDFGVAHLVDNRTSLGVKGTLLYMSPEQIQMKTPSALSDIFALGVVCYETLTRRHPFERASRDEIAEAILHHIPPAASDLNPSVNPAISQVVHASMAKQPWHRISSAREFADCLQKALRNESIERFQPAKIQPRIERAQKALDDGEYEFAAEILEELQAEGYLHPEINPMRRQIDQAIRAKAIRQLMESARKRLQEHEYQLALQKVQEVLDREPGHPDALALRAAIESQRNTQQIEGWFRVARQHIENNAFEHARQALQNVLELTPGDPAALQLLAELDAAEQEYHRVRQEKDRLYQAALNAWHNGDVSSALTKLERVLELDRNAPDTFAPERGTSYQSLYNQIRSEYETLKNAYTEARKHLDDHRFTEALAICGEYLAKYPDHALFRALQFDVENRQRQELSAFIARIDREVENEPDLERRVAILTDAIQQHPGSHFEQALQTAKSKRDLVNSIVAKARNLEERGQFAEALAQCEILRTVYAEYPGLDFEIERLAKRREQQARAEAKARWAEQIDRSLNLGDYAKAGSLAQGALSEFPGDAELAALEQQVRRGLENRAQTEKLLEESRNLMAAERPEDALATLRQAYQQDERNPQTRALLMDALMRRARACVEADWRQAEALAQEAAAIDPSSPVAKNMRLMVADRKRAQIVDECLAQARNAQASSDLEAAVAHVERGLSFASQDPRLVQLQASLKKQVSENHRSQERKRDLEEIHRVERRAEATGDPEELRSLFLETVTIAQRHPEDPDFGVVVGELERRANAAAPAQPAAEVPAPPEERRQTGIHPAWVAGFAIVALALTGGAIWKLRRGRAERPQPAAVVLAIRTVPPGALVTVDGRPVASNTPVPLPPGRTYRLEAHLEGYQSVTREFKPTPESRGPVELVLLPLAASIKVSTDLSSGTVMLDQAAPADLQDGQFTLNAVADGPHTLTLSAGKLGEVSIPVVMAAGTVPRIPQPLVSADLSVLVVAFAGGQGRLYTSAAGAELSIDGQRLGKAAPEGLELKGVSPGVHKIALRHGREQHNFEVEAGAAPGLSISVLAGSNVGVLDIASNETDFQVFINDRLRRVQKRRQGYAIPNLEAGSYTVRIAKQGYTAEPAAQPVEIHKGEHTSAQFTLRKIPTTATLHVSGTPEGADLLIDGETHAIGPDGLFTGPLEPGRHRIEGRKDGYQPYSKVIDAAAGETVEVQVRMEKIYTAGHLVLSISPPTAQVFRKRGNEPEVRMTQLSEELPVGSYTLRVIAPNYAPELHTVTIAGGEEARISIRLNALATAPRELGMKDWMNPGEWKAERGWMVHRGGNHVLYGAQPSAGRFVFTLFRQSGLFGTWKGVTWVVGHMNDKTWTQFRIDRTNLYRRGPDGKEEKIGPHGYEKNAESYDFEVTIASGHVTIASFPKRARKAIFDWAGAPAAVDKGRFGFYIPSGQEVYLANFKFYPAH